MLSRVLIRLGVTPPPQDFLGGVGYMRHVQATRESGAFANPDHVVGQLLGPHERWRARHEDVSNWRTNGFYRYPLARTRHYDELVKDAISGGAGAVVFFGVGTDTRSIRFANAFDAAGVAVLETDLARWIPRRKRKLKRLATPKELRHSEVDLETTDLLNWWQNNAPDTSAPILFVAEGVAPYVSKSAVEGLIRLVGSSSPPGSLLAFDGKYCGIDDGATFRIRADHTDIHELSSRHGLEVQNVNQSAEIQLQYTPYRDDLFTEDVAIALRKPGTAN